MAKTKDFEVKFDGWRPLAILDAMISGPTDVLRLFKVKPFIERWNIWRLQLGGEAAVLPAGRNLPWAARELRIGCATVTGLERASFTFSVGVRAGEEIVWSAPMPANEWAANVRIMLPDIPSGVPLDLLIQSERPGLVQLGEVDVLSPDGSAARANYRGLPGVGHSEVLVVPHDGEHGHALYGPYTPLGGGDYVLEWTCLTDGEGDPEEPLLRIELLVGDEIKVERNVTRGELGGDIQEVFQAHASGAQKPLEFRISHYQRANLIMVKAELVRV